MPIRRMAVTVVAAVLSVVWAGVLALRHLEGQPSILDRIEAPLADLRLLLAGPRPPPDDLVIVALDDETARGAGSHPIPRPLVARLIRTLHGFRPRVLGVDVLFIDPGPPAGDRQLAEALREAQAVVAAAAVFSTTQAAPDIPPGTPWADIPNANRILLPVTPLREISGTGIVNITTDLGGTPRHVPLVVRTGDTIVPSFPLRLATLAAGSDPIITGDRLRIGTVESSLDIGRNLPLRFYGPRGTIRTVSAHQVLEGGAPGYQFQDRVVIIGSTAIGAGDTFTTPFDPVFPGVEVLATAVGHLLSGDGLVRTSMTRRIDAVAAIALPAATILIFALHRVGLGLAALACLVGGWAVLASFAYSHGIWLSMTVPLAALLPPAAFFTVARLWIDRSTERRLEKAQADLRRFHPPALADRLERTPDFLAAPVEQQAAVLFVDLTGFTGLSEKLGPHDTHSLLKQFHTLVEDEATRHGGIVLSFMGDGALIAFGVPDAGEQDSRRAAECAIALIRAVEGWARSLRPDCRGLTARVGVHFGPVVVSRLGPDTHQHITTTGDSVNVASRLLEVAAQRKAAIAFSTDLLDRAGVTVPPEFSEEHEVPIRGRSQSLKVRFWHPVPRPA